MPLRRRRPLPRLRRLLPVLAWMGAGVAGCRTAGGGAEGPAPAPSATAAAPLPEAAVTFDSAWGIIARTYWDTTFNGVDWRAVRDTLRPRAAAARSTDALRAVLTDMLGRLGQSHFAIIPREAADGDPAEAHGGDGVTGLELRWIEGELVAWRVEPGSPAAAAGITPGFVLEAIDGAPAVRASRRAAATGDPRRLAWQRSAAAMNRLAGMPGTPVSVTVRDGADRRRSVAPTRVPAPGTAVKFGSLPPVQAELAAERRAVGDRTVGVLRFNVWMPALIPAVDSAIDALRDADAIVLDLRGNPGGVVGMAMGLAGHFVDTLAPLGIMRQRTNTLKVVAFPRRVNTRLEGVSPFAGPLAIVVDEQSFSTSEIFAAGLQALGRARVFGATTGGQALPSLPERLPNGDLLYHAIADFTTPSGRPVEGPGVTPDSITPHTRPALLAGEDPALDAAIRWGAGAARARGPRQDDPSLPSRPFP